MPEPYRRSLQNKPVDNLRVVRPNGEGRTVKGVPKKQGFPAMQSLPEIQARTRAPLQTVRGMRAEDGPPL